MSTTPEIPIDLDHDLLAAKAGELGLRLVVLYGSHARGTASAESDLDLAVLGCPDERYWESFRSLARLLEGYTLDLVRLEAADPLFRYEIMQDAVLLCGDADLFYEYRAFAYRDFMDSSDLFDLEETLSRKKTARLREELHGSP